MDDRHLAHCICDVDRLRLSPFQVLSPGRDIVEEVPDGNGCPVGSAHLLSLRNTPLLQAQIGAGERGSCPGHDRNAAADAGYAGQGFAAKAQGGDGAYVLRIPDLGCGMLLKCQRQIVGGYAAAVICYLDEALSTIGDLN